MVIQKFIWNCKEAHIAKTIVKKKKKLESYHFLTSKLTKKLWQSKQWGNDLQRDIEINIRIERIKRTEIKVCVCCQQIFQQDCQDYSTRKE